MSPDDELRRLAEAAIAAEAAVDRAHEAAGGEDLRPDHPAIAADLRARSRLALAMSTSGVDALLLADGTVVALAMEADGLLIARPDNVIRPGDGPGCLPGPSPSEN